MLMFFSTELLFKTKLEIRLHGFDAQSKTDVSKMFL